MQNGEQELLNQIEQKKIEVIINNKTKENRIMPLTLYIGYTKPSDLLNIDRIVSSFLQLERTFKNKENFVDCMHYGICSARRNNKLKNLMIKSKTRCKK